LLKREILEENFSGEEIADKKIADKKNCGHKKILQGKIRNFC
jgi:hypothetical protein